MTVASMLWRTPIKLENAQPLSGPGGRPFEATSRHPRFENLMAAGAGYRLKSSLSDAVRHVRLSRMGNVGGSSKCRKAISAKDRIVLQPARRQVPARNAGLDEVKRGSAEDLGTPIARYRSASPDAKGMGVLTH
jgi:hypothetical protein